MGYFAVISKDGDAPSVERCHINLWRYDGFFTPNVCLFDVGFALTAPAAPAIGKKFRIALPFSTDDVKPVDLATLMRSEKVATLIFGRVVTVRGDVVSYEDRDGPVQMKITSPEKVSLDPDKSKHAEGYSLWNVELESPPRGNERLYVRLRFHVAAFPRGWVRQGDAEILDFRIADTRESVANSDWSFAEASVVPLPNIRVFVIAPASRRPLVSSPAFNARALEGSVWKAYTRCRAAWWSRAASRFTVIYSFRPGEGNPTKPSNPFRLYFTMGRRRWPRSLWFLGGGIALLIAVLASVGVSDWQQIVDRAWNALKIYLLGLASLGGIFTLLSRGRWLVQQWSFLGALARGLDRWRLFDKE